MADLRLSDTLDTYEIAMLFHIAEKQERKRHTALYGSTRKALLKENLELIGAQWWEEVCPFFGWEGTYEFNHRHLASELHVDLQIHNDISEDIDKEERLELAIEIGLVDGPLFDSKEYRASHKNCDWCLGKWNDYING